MAKQQQITSKDVMNYYASMFGGHRQFEGMRLDSGSKECLVVIDLQHDFMPDRDYYKITMAKMLEIERPDLQNLGHKYKLVKKLIVDENGNEVEQLSSLPNIKFSELPGKLFDSSKTEYFKEWLNSYNIT
jgi:hypothetical protein